ncbi:MAG: hypothetical protein LBT47_09310 [Deltaproteobacteria bacterium]|jgi:hypothetical protein|nr:hypothetical protein [Deltaproteobacteria bacterium]
MDIFNNLIAHLEIWWGVVETIVAAIGLFLVVKGLAGLTDSGSRQRHQALIAIVAGILMLNFSVFSDALARTIFGTDSSEILSYRPPTEVGTDIIRFVFVAVGLTGLVGVGRGLYILRLSPGDGGGLARALVHLAGGILCLNLPEFLRILASSFGGEVEVFITSVIG